MTDRTQAATGGPTLSLVRLVLLGAAFAMAGAGLVHLDAAGDHTDHAFIATFFVVAGVLQLLLALAISQQQVPRLVILAAVTVNAGLLLTWVVSRTVGLDVVPGLSWVPGITGQEPLGLKDMATAALEIVSLLMVGLASVIPAAAGAMLLAPLTAQRAVAGLVAGALALAVPGVLASHAHQHDDGHHEETAHPHGEHEAIRVHEHGDGKGHAHGPEGHRGGENHVHSEVDHGAGHGGHPSGHADHNGSPGHDHDGSAGHHPDGADSHHHGAGPAVPAERDPLVGPGRISTLRLGPFPLPPTIDPIRLPHVTPWLPGVAPGKLNVIPLVGIAPPCTNCYVLGAQPDLVYADGRPANLDTGPMLHHAVLTDPSRDDAVCHNHVPGLLGERIFAAGNERTGMSMPDGYGLPLGTSRLGGAMELMNMSSKLRNVYFELTVRWVPRTTADIEPVRPLWLDIDGCGDSEIDIDAGVADLGWSWTSNVTGRIVAAGGHLHDGGEWLSLHNATSRQHVCTSVAGYGADPRAEGSLDSMSYCAWDRLATVREGERLRLNAHYNTALPQHGVMGIMLAFVHETSDLDGGRPSPYPTKPPADGAPPDAGHHH